MITGIGIDFGTTNTVVGLSTGDVVTTLRFTQGTDQAMEASDTFPSALCFRQVGHGRSASVTVDGGLTAIAQFLTTEDPHRFLQSFKSFAASSSFSETRIFSKSYKFENLLETFLQCLQGQWPGLEELRNVPIIVGRPVVFAGAAPDEALALQRYRSAFGQAGWPKAEFAFEPLGAAHFFAQTLTRDANILVVDIGGGTSDFSVLRFKPGQAGLRVEPLSHGGIGLAGDHFDYRIIDHVISPQLGKGSQYRSFDKRLNLPNRYYANFARWNFLSLMKGSGELTEMRKLLRDAEQPKQLQGFIDLIDQDLGYMLYRAVSAAKSALSSQDEVEFTFNQGGVALSATISRVAFESWIAEDLEKIAQSADQTLGRAGLNSAAIDRVFLTGGSSFIPALRAKFAQRFGPAKLAGGGEFTSIATGLALIAQTRGQR